jgi:hypothetical protein
MIIVITISIRYLGPDSVNSNAIWWFSDRLFYWAMALISALFVGSLRRSGVPTQHDAWYQITLCLYFVALFKLLLDVDFGFLITVLWWMWFFTVTRRYLTRSCAVVQSMSFFTIHVLVIQAYKYVAFNILAFISCDSYQTPEAPVNSRPVIILRYTTPYPDYYLHTRLKL